MTNFDKILTNDYSSRNDCRIEEKCDRDRSFLRYRETR